MSGTLTTAQLTTLQTWVTTNHAADLAAGNVGLICAALNLTDASNTAVYSPAIPNTMLAAAIVSSDVAGLTVQQAIAVQIMLMPASIDGTNATVQGNIGGLFSGKTTLTNFQALARHATVFEKLFIVSNVMPMGANGTSLYGFQVQVADILAAGKGSY